MSNFKLSLYVLRFCQERGIKGKEREIIAWIVRQIVCKREDFSFGLCLSGCDVFGYECNPSLCENAYTCASGAWNFVFG